jgi:hypothetical protein
MIRAAFALLAFMAASCDTSFFLRGTLHGDCDAPRVTRNDLGTEAATLRKSNCQPPSSVCCRTSTKATRVSCEYPEDCYVAPYMGPCATPVDCADTQSCDNGSCQCRLGGPPCENPASHVVTCCATFQVCDTKMGTCSAASNVDGGTF